MQPVSPEPSIAYLIVSHKLPRQVLRLVSTLRLGSPDSHIVIHHNPKGVALDRSALAALDARQIEPATPVLWGHISHLIALLRCFSWLLTHTTFDWLVLLSGQDYPVRPLADIERDLATANVDAFIESHACPRPRGRQIDEFAMRYHFRWRQVPPWVTHMRACTPWTGVVRVRSLPRSGSWLGVRARRSPFSDSFVCHVGSDWFTLSRRALESLNDFNLLRPDVLEYYGHTLMPTESFLQTVLANQPGLRLAADSRRFTIWDEPPATAPRILGAPDLAALVESRCDFARKFDESVDRTVLDELDRRIGAT